MFKRIYLWIALIGLISGCGALQTVDEGATLEALNAGYGTESVNLITTGAVERAGYSQTAIVLETQVAFGGALNRELLATLAIQVTPTPPLVGETRADDLGIIVDVTAAAQGNPIVSTPANVPFITTGLSTSVREEDGCVVGPQSIFPLNVSRIYATLRATNLQRGTRMRAEWYREGEQVWFDDWTVDTDYESLCIWFFLQPSYVEFSTGNWSVQMYADGQPIGQAMRFSFNDGM
ncbi:MAG: hypothetical protein MUF87_18990 [Anaerolineae bacterium]|nr:hypothetical protein [Anaerolineae bacterium]